ncbi:MAG TPA: bifunctional riboflavin kinase/FAD synthetase [Anaerolineaceae bacterium]|nr:bifunctional riboflavin kinase/FAD synthetase [Anaerolineaceae bacterium]
MRHSTTLESVHLQGAWVSIGIFDGVHAGHQQLIRHLTNGASSAGLPSVVVTFHPHPAAILKGRTDAIILTNPEERAVLLGTLGVDQVITLPFTASLAAETAETFIRRLVDAVEMKRLVVGPNFALGRNRSGDIPTLKELGARLGFTVDVVEPVVSESGIISSSRIRKALGEGNLVEANRMLGRMVSIPGVVIHGDGRGRGLGFPTANLALEPDRILPANGVYATWVWLEGKAYRAVTNIGLRPTFENTPPQPRVEAHLLNFDRDIYGCPLRLEFAARLRPEQRFHSVDALLAQIHQDVLVAREVLTHAPQSPDIPA